MLPVDDEAWETDWFECPLYDDEVSQMKDIPGLEFKPVERKRALIGDGKDHKGKK